MWKPDDSGSPLQWQEAQTASGSLRIQLLPLEVRTAGELDRSIEGATRGQANAFLVLRSVLFYVLLKRIVALAEKNHLPGMYPSSEFVDDGGLMSYGAKNKCQYRASHDVDRILKGIKPANLPIEAPNQVRIRDQSQSRETDRRDHSPVGVVPRRQGGQITFWIFRFWIESQENKPMNAFPSKSLSDNRKSAIQNRKWAGLFVIVVAFTVCGARAQAQQPTKVPRIGYLSVSSPSANVGPHRGIPTGSARAWLRGGKKHCH